MHINCSPLYFHWQTIARVFRPRLKFPGWAMPTLIFSPAPPCRRPWHHLRMSHQIELWQAAFASPTRHIFSKKTFLTNPIQQGYPNIMTNFSAAVILFICLCSGYSKSCIDLYGWIFRVDSSCYIDGWVVFWRSRSWSFVSYDNHYIATTSDTVTLMHN